MRIETVIRIVERVSEVETRKRKKVVAGEVVSFNGESVKIVAE